MDLSLRMFPFTDTFVMCSTPLLIQESCSFKYPLFRQTFIRAHLDCRGSNTGPPSYLRLLLFLFPLLYLPFHRRGNWITLKLKKLIKSSSREHAPDRPPTPTHSGIAQPHHFCHDNSSAGDAISPQRNSSEYDRL